MAYGMHGAQWMLADVASNSTRGTGVCVQGANHVAFYIPALGSDFVTTTANVYFMAAQTQAGTYYRVKDIGTYSANSGIQDWEVPSTTGGFIVSCRPAVHYDYVKIQFSNTATNGCQCYVIAHR